MQICQLVNAVGAFLLVWLCKSFTIVIFMSKIMIVYIIGTLHCLKIEYRPL